MGRGLERKERGMLRRPLEGCNLDQEGAVGGWAAAAGSYVPPAPRTDLVPADAWTVFRPSLERCCKKLPCFSSCRMDIGPGIRRLDTSLATGPKRRQGFFLPLPLAKLLICAW